MFSNKIKNFRLGSLFLRSPVYRALSRYSIIAQRGLISNISHDCNSYVKLRKHPIYHSYTRPLKIDHLVFGSDSSIEEIDTLKFENICEETLDSLYEFFEDTIESSPLLKAADVSFGDGVLTVNLGKFGTYVVNRQSPNKQIWLSSPTSGPKRYDFVKSRNGWVYRHNNQTLHSLLQEEISVITKSSVDLTNCAYCGDFK